MEVLGLVRQGYLGHLPQTKFIRKSGIGWKHIILIMKNNWIITGDGDSYSEFRGLLYLSEEDMSRWQDVVLEKIRSVKSEKLQEYVKRNPYITIAALFYRGWEISQEDYDHFVNDACAEFWDAQPVLCKLDLGKKRKRNIICIGFASIGSLRIRMRS